MITALIIVTLAALWAAINAVVFIGTRESVQRMSPNEYRPWHWTVLVGPFAYYPWLRRHEEVAYQPPVAQPVDWMVMEVLDNRQDRNPLRRWNADGREVCVHCLQPLPPASVGSEWKP